MTTYRGLLQYKLSKLIETPLKMKKTPWERFISFVKFPEDLMSNDCWEWVGPINMKGYGTFTPIPGQSTNAHRWFYEILSGELLPKYLVVMHSCDVRHCVNPTHLNAGTQSENIKDAIEKGRMALGSLNGRATISEKEVKEIRDLHKAGVFSLRQLRQHYGITDGALQNIVYYRSWLHI